ncbi:aminotransferase class IV [Leucobacter weissii]|uniref:Aminotransferase class IV n=1 Tax=Leucobacter weissii TaxID=1983706 RepID=A0A939MLS2_9MICO|nr:aminotransferase class IV [Leucobacter weissii]MBO1902896.1 aminotransferase class IV [Leucobacter weissii]
MDALLAADSFRVRVRGGRAEVRGLDRHLERFTASVREPSSGASPPSPDELSAFILDARARIADYGAGFPRLELRRHGGTTELRLSLRPLPALGRTVELRSAPGVRLPDPRRKGPNISLLADLNRELGAEALLLDETGHALEGATTGLVWWPPGNGRDPATDRGYLVADDRRVPSVTESLLLDAADGRLEGAAASPEQLAEQEVWAVNALHGIRPVTSIDGAALPRPDERRLHRFREALDRSWQPVTS